MKKITKNIFFIPIVCCGLSAFSAVNTYFATAFGIVLCLSAFAFACSSIAFSVMPLESCIRKEQIEDILNRPRFGLSYWTSKFILYLGLLGGSVISENLFFIGGSVFVIGFGELAERSLHKAIAKFVEGN